MFLDTFQKVKSKNTYRSFLVFLYTPACELEKMHFHLKKGEILEKQENR